MFRTQYDKDVKQFSEVGSRTRPIFAAEYDEKGRIVFEQVSEEDTYAFIQSFADSVDIYSILDRYQNGEIDVLDRVQGFYMDVTDMPRTYRDVLNMNLKTEQFFDGLPVDVKQEFGNSFEQFMISLGEKDFMERIGKYYEGPNHSNADSGVDVLVDDKPVSDGVD